MKKIIFGISVITLSPFIIIFGSMLLNAFKIQQGAFTFASIIGGISIGINYIIAVIILFAGHAEIKTFKSLSS